MNHFKRLTAVVLVIIIGALTFGCMEETSNTTTEGQNLPQGGGDTNGGAVSSPMDVEITNIDYEFTEHPDDPFAQPDLHVTCDAINYGGAGRATVVIVANATNVSTTMEQVVSLGENEQVNLDFYGKMPEEPTNITGYAKRELLDLIPNPKTSDMDVEISNLYYDSLSWADENHTEIDASAHATAINYGQPGYVTVVVNMSGPGFTKQVEERVHIDWYEQQDMHFDTKLPAPPTNLTARIKRPQVD